MPYKFTINYLNKQERKCIRSEILKLKIKVNSLKNLSSSHFDLFEKNHEVTPGIFICLKVKINVLLYTESSI